MPAQSASRSTSESRRGYHRLALYQTCPQAFSYRYNLELESLRVSEQLALGTLVHLGLEHRYRAALGQKVGVLEPIEAMRNAPARVAYVFARALEIYKAYAEQWEIDPLKPVDVEREFELRVNGQVYTQRVDLVAELGGRIVFVDHKTSARVSTSASQWETSGQFAGYSLIAKHLVESIYKRPFGGVIVNLVATQAPYKFKRLPVLMPTSFVDAMTIGLARTYANMNADAERDPWQYTRHMDACWGRYGQCSYLELCKRGKFALDEYLIARDEVTAIAEGATR